MYYNLFPTEKLPEIKSECYNIELWHKSHDCKIHFCLHPLSGQNWTYRIFSHRKMEITKNSTFMVCILAFWCGKCWSLLCWNGLYHCFFAIVHNEPYLSKAVLSLIFSFKQNLFQREFKAKVWRIFRRVIGIFAHQKETFATTWTDAEKYCQPQEI